MSTKKDFPWVPFVGLSSLIAIGTSGVMMWGWWFLLMTAGVYFFTMALQNDG